jgi:hypothetical protein
MANTPTFKRAPGNNASDTLNGGINASDLTITLNDASEFSANGGMICIDRGSASEEFIYYESKTGNVLTVATDGRGQEGTSDQGHNDGASVDAVITAAQWNDLLDEVVTESTAQTITGVKTFSASPVFSEDINLATGKNVQVNSADPNRTITIMPGLLKPTTTAGCASSATVEAGTNDIDYDVLDFDKDTDESAFANFHMPDSWDAGVVQFRYIWTCTGAGADETVAFELGGRSLANDDAIDQAQGTAVEVSDTRIADADIHISSWSGDVTLAGTPAAGELVHIEITRDVSEDNLAVDARLIAIQIRYKVAQYSD